MSNLNKPTVNFRREPDSTTHQLFADCRRALLLKGDVENAKSVDSLTSWVKPMDWRTGVQEAQSFCVLNIIEVNKPPRDPGSFGEGVKARDAAQWTAKEMLAQASKNLGKFPRK